MPIIHRRCRARSSSLRVGGLYVRVCSARSICICFPYVRFLMSLNMHTFVQATSLWVVKKCFNALARIDNNVLCQKIYNIYLGFRYADILLKVCTLRFPPSHSTVQLKHAYAHNLLTHKCKTFSKTKQQKLRITYLELL